MSTDLTLGEPDAGRDQRNLDAAHWEGYIDAIEGGRVYGWALDASDKGRRLSITLTHGSDELATLVADRFREDLVGYGDGSGLHAFVYTLPRHLWEASPDEFHARFAGTDVPLLRGRRAMALATEAEPANAGEETVEPATEPERDRLAGRVEALERSIIGLMRLIDPRSESSKLLHRGVRGDLDRLQRGVADLQRDLRAIEPFVVRLDERLKDREGALLDHESARKKPPTGQIVAVAVLLTAAAGLGYAAATFLI